MCHDLTQEIRANKTPITYQSDTADKFITKKHKQALSNFEITHCGEIKPIS